jgi:hypothetical protein
MIDDGWLCSNLWNGWFTREIKALGEHLHHCRVLHHKSHMIWPGPPHWQAGDQPSELRHGPSPNTIVLLSIWGIWGTNIPFSHSRCSMYWSGWSFLVTLILLGRLWLWPQNVCRFYRIHIPKQSKQNYVRQINLSSGARRIWVELKW